MTHFASLSDGRRLAYDDVGDGAGVPVLYLHGCPDCRRTRHPDDSIARELGMRLVAVDRPGYGSSASPSDHHLASQASDLLELVDALQVERVGLFAWSSGAMPALAMAAQRSGVIGAVAIAAGTLPNPGPVDDDELAEIVSLLVPETLTPELAAEHVREGKSASYLRDLESVPGLEARLASAMTDAVAHGTNGVAFDVRAAATSLPFDLAEIDVPVALWYGEKDDVVPMSTGEHLAAALPRATLHAVPDASHLIAITHWATILESLRSELSCP